MTNHSPSNTRLWLVALMVMSVNFSKLTENNQTFRNDFVWFIITSVKFQLILLSANFFLLMNYITNIYNYLRYGWTHFLWISNQINVRLVKWNFNTNRFTTNLLQKSRILLIIPAILSHVSYIACMQFKTE